MGKNDKELQTVEKEPSIFSQLIVYPFTNKEKTEKFINSQNLDNKNCSVEIGKIKNETVYFAKIASFSEKEAEQYIFSLPTYLKVKVIKV